jgi:hypothetical protein
LSADFGAGDDGFIYVDDAFRGTTQPAYATGSHVPSGGFTGGALLVRLGGVDDAVVVGMSGGVQRSFAVTTAPTSVRVTFRVNLTQAANYESDEVSDALFSIDGQLLGLGGTDRLARITGDGNGGSARSTGWQLVELDLGPLAVGTHTLVFGGDNSKKTLADESTDVLVDDVTVLAF